MRNINTEQDILDAMGNLATEQEAEIMREILTERGIENFHDQPIPDDEWQSMIQECVKRAEQCDAAQ